MRRLVAQFLFARIARQLAQVLAVGVRVFGEQVGQRGVAVGNQLVAQGFDAMQRGGFAARIGLVVLDRGADGIQRLVFFRRICLARKPTAACARSAR